MLLQPRLSRRETDRQRKGAAVAAPDVAVAVNGSGTSAASESDGGLRGLDLEATPHKPRAVLRAGLAMTEPADMLTVAEAVKVAEAPCAAEKTVKAKMADNAVEEARAIEAAMAPEAKTELTAHKPHDPFGPPKIYYRGWGVLRTPEAFTNPSETEAAAAQDAHASFKKNDASHRFGSRTRGQRRRELCFAFIGLLALLYIPHTKAAMTTPSRDWSPPTLVSFLAGLRAVDADVSGGTCVLTEESRDRILDQLARTHHEGTEMDHRWLHDRGLLQQSEDLASESTDDTDDGGGGGCDDQVGCAWAGRLAVEKVDRVSFHTVENAVVERQDSDEEQEQRRLTSGDCPLTCYDQTCDYWAALNSLNTCSELIVTFGCDCSGCDRCSPTAVPSSPPTDVPSTSPVPTATRTPTPAPTSSQVPTTSRPTAAPLEVEAATFAQLDDAVAQAAASGASLTVSLVVDIVMTGALSIFSPVSLRSDTGAILKGGRTTQMFRIYGPSGRLSGANITLRGGYTSERWSGLCVHWRGSGVQWLYVDG